MQVFFCSQEKNKIMNKLKAITTKAKQLYRSGKYAKWTDAIKAASKQIGAVKIIQKGESKNARVTKVLQQTRTKTGTFKGYKTISGTKKQIGSVENYQIIDNNNKFYSRDLKGNTKFNAGKDLGYLFTQSEAKKISDALNKLGYNTKVVKYGTVGAIKKRKIASTHKDSKSHNVNIRVVSGVPSYSDPDMAREIQLYADNDSRLYFSRKLPILKNLQRKYKKGNYKTELAAKLWLYFVNDALQRYNKEFGSRGDKWHQLMTVPDRKLLAMEYAIDTLNEFEMGNFIVD